MKKRFTRTRRSKALLWLLVVTLSLLLYLVISDYHLTPQSTLLYTEEISLFEPMKCVACFDDFTFNGETYHPILAENKDYLVLRLPWFRLSTGWQEGGGHSVMVHTENGWEQTIISPLDSSAIDNIGGGYETGYFDKIDDHRAFFYGKISDPKVASWELQSTVSYVPPALRDFHAEGDAVTVPITEEWVETDDARYFFFTIDTHAVWQQLGDQYNYNTLMHLYDDDGNLLDTIDLGEQWTAFREE